MWTQCTAGEKQVFGLAEATRGCELHVGESVLLLGQQYFIFYPRCHFEKHDEREQRERGRGTGNRQKRGSSFVAAHLVFTWVWEEEEELLSPSYQNLCCRSCRACWGRSSGRARRAPVEEGPTRDGRWTDTPTHPVSGGGESFGSRCPSAAEGEVRLLRRSRACPEGGEVYRQ